MADIFRTLILPAAVTPLAQQIAATLSPAGVGMWTTGLSATGQEPATHFISTGFIPPDFAYMTPEQFWEQDETGAWVQTGSTPGDPVAVYEACVAAGMTVTLAEVEGIFAVADITAQDPFVAMGRLGVMIVEPPLSGGSNG